MSPVGRAALALIVCLGGVAAARNADARRSGDDDGGDEGRDRFVGRIIARPDGPVGPWTVGARVFVADVGVELDTADGPLTVGACAQVDVRGGRVHEIDSEPSSHCP